MLKWNCIIEIDDEKCRAITVERLYRYKHISGEKYVKIKVDKE